MWMGGVVPLGYRVQDRKLLIEPAEAEQVRHIFARYLQLGSVLALHGELEASGIFGRARTIRGTTRAPKPMSRGALYLLLSNRIYLGEICHKGSSYPGEHEQLIDAKLFERLSAFWRATATTRTPRPVPTSPVCLPEFCGMHMAGACRPAMRSSSV
jgi:hypothetical protein